jgi:voltage-gated potassium channel Kch
VLHDVTARTWWLRQIARALMQALPVGIVVGLLIPGSLVIRVLAVLGGVFVAMIYVLAFIDEAVEHRAVKAGFPRGYAKAMREAAQQPERDAAARRYTERYRR